MKILKGFTILVVLFRSSAFLLPSRCLQSFSRTFFCKMKKDNSDLKALSLFYKPKTSNQKHYVNYLNDQSIKVLLAVGPAGTGKTLLACNQAIRDLKSGLVEKIVLTRPIVPVEEEELGFLPGNINKKMDPWTRPIFDIFNEFYQKKDLENMLYNNVIEISPLAFMRGRTFKNAFIIADEMQNSTPNQMLMLTTRIGENSKMVVIGDLKQSDRGINSGLSDFINKYKKYDHFLNKNNKEVNIGIKIVELTSDDIERSKVVRKILDIYEFMESISINCYDKNDLDVIIPLNKISSEHTLKNIENNDAALIPFSHLQRQIYF